MKSTILYTIYEYDTALFVTVFCENKDRPQLNCNGKCYLSKMYKEESEKSTSNTIKQFLTEVVYCNTIPQPFDFTDSHYYRENSNKLPSYYSNLYTFLYTDKISKPPSVSSYC